MTHQIKISNNHSKYLEDSVLGIMFFEPAKAPIICNLLFEDYFYYDFNKLVFKTISEMVGDYKKIDYITVSEAICISQKSKNYNGEKISYLLGQMMKDVVSGAHIESWCDIIIHYYKSRNIESISDISSSDLSTFEKQQKIVELLKKSEISKHNNSWIKMGDVLNNFIIFYSENQGKNILGLEFGFKKLDWLLSGCRGGDLIILGARPSIGKSALASQIAVNVARSFKSVGIVTLEMTNQQLVGRMISYATETNYEDINRLKAPLDHMERSALSMADLPIIFSEETKCSIEGIRASFQKLNLSIKVDILIIDYVQLMESEAKTHTKNDEVGKITRGLKQMAKEHDIPVIALAQLNREGVAKGEPQLESLRDSGNIEQDADKVIFLHGDRELQDRLVIVAKNRSGKLGKVPMRYQGDYMKFIEVGDVQNISDNISPTEQVAF